MENNIKISVVIPVYNTAIFLSRCLESLHEQSYRSVEYILVDDGSKDNSLEICNHFAKMDDRFVVISKENGGPSSARNLAISKARGEYVTFVDSDDYVRSDAYEVIAAKLEANGNPDCLIFGANLTPANAPDYMRSLVNTRTVTYTEFSPEVLFDETGSRPFLWLQVMKRSIIVDNNIKMDESIKLGEDQLFQMEFMPLAKTFVFTSDKLYYYRWKRPGSIMHETSEKKLSKTLLHVDLVDKVFSLMERKEQGVDMMNKVLGWSVNFLFYDLFGMLEENQYSVVSALVTVWEKHNYRNYYDAQTNWVKNKIDVIMLMSEPDRDKRIEKLSAAKKELEGKLSELKNTPQYAAYVKKTKEKSNPFGKLMISLKEDGIVATVKKIYYKLKRKFFN